MDHYKTGTMQLWKKQKTIDYMSPLSKDTGINMEMGIIIIDDPLASEKVKDAIQYARNQKECFLEKMPRHLGDTYGEYLSDMVPWCNAYKTYEARQREDLLTLVLPPGNEKPSLTRKNPIKRAV